MMKGRFEVPRSRVFRSPRAGDFLMTVRSGSCWVVHAFDVGYQVDLAWSQKLCQEQTVRPQFSRQHRTPAEFGYTPEPLRVLQSGPAILVDGSVAEGQMDVTLFDFGAMTVVQRFDLAGRTFAELVELSATLDEDERLEQEARRTARELLDRVRPAVERPELSSISEDYVIWEIHAFEDGTVPAASLERWRHVYAKIIRAEPEDLSEEEIAAALSLRISYGPNDLTVVDWNGALILGPADADVRAVLEFANIELLEMRLLDTQLDEGIEEVESILGRGRPTKAALERVAHLQLDSVFLFEAVNNALKLMGAQYLARVYKLASRSFELEGRDRTIHRKIGVLSDTYGKLENRASAWRMEILELAIVLLIVFEFAFALFQYFLKR